MRNWWRKVASLEKVDQKETTSKYVLPSEITYMYVLELWALLRNKSQR